MPPSVFRPIPMRVEICDFVWQMRKLTLEYCPRGGSSRGLREYIEQRRSQLAQENPQIILEVKERRGHHPVLRGIYLNGREKVICVKNLSVDSIETQVQLLRNTDGSKIRKVSDVQTRCPSIQGIWNPFLHV
jgi:large subunit ribosomal protein L43